MKTWSVTALAMEKEGLKARMGELAARSKLVDAEIERREKERAGNAAKGQAKKLEPETAKPKAEKA